MSYSFNMCFKKISSLAKAMEYAKKFVDSMTNDDIKQEIEHNYYYIPTVRYALKSDDYKNEQAYHEWNMGWARDLLAIKFVYFKEQQLLGVVGANYAHQKEFFKTVCHFQNSCDQDYEREEWGKIKYFTDIWDECQNAGLDTLAENYAKKYGYTKAEVLEEWENEYKDGMDDEHLNYKRRSFAYDLIYDNLGLDDWLWGNDNDEKFTRFSLSWINTLERDYFVAGVMRKYEKEQDA